MKPHILISGGTGLVGSHLAHFLIHQGYSVSFLTRGYRSLTGIEVIRWNPEEQWIDDFSLEGPLAIINLSGENLAAKPWTPEQKEKIRDSRINSLKTIKKLILQKNNQITHLVSTSAIGYYGTFTSNQIFTEDSPPGSDFLAETCVKWEEAIREIQDLGVPTSWVRTGVVLSDRGGVLKAIQDSMRLGIAIHIGSGKQWIPWIHIRDLVQLFEFLLAHPELGGVFNGVAPVYDTNKSLTKAIAKKTKKFLLPLGLPAPILKMILGEMSILSLYGSRVSAQKILDAGFNFQFTDLESALASFQPRKPGDRSVVI